MSKQFIAKSLVLLCALLLTSAYADSGDKKAKFQVLVQNNSDKNVYYQPYDFVQHKKGVYKIQPGENKTFSLHHHSHDFPTNYHEHFHVFFGGEGGDPMSVHCGRDTRAVDPCCILRHRGGGDNEDKLSTNASTRPDVCGFEGFQVRVTASS